MVIFRCLNPEKITFFMYISVNSVRKRISIVLFTQLLKYLHRPIGIEYWNLKLKIFINNNNALKDFTKFRPRTGIFIVSWKNSLSTYC